MSSFPPSGAAPQPALASHPGPASVRLPRRLADEITAHARAELPLEACGVIPGSAASAHGGLPRRYEPCRNLAASATRYQIHPEDFLRVLTALDAQGGSVWAFVHSHPTSAAIPSRLDVSMALYPDALYLVVSLAGSAPDLRAWRIVRGERYEVALEIA